MKMFIKIVLTVLIVIVLFVGGAVFYITRGLSSGSKLVIGDVDLSLLDNGTYNGKYNAGRWTNEVNVVINDHKIIEIDVIKDVTFPIADFTKKLFDEVIQKQTPKVDVVSGATVTGKAYLKSIENALKK
jgi:uncharacterized protein with FMN-binding domain